MKIVFLHTDFRVYWLPRLKHLGKILHSHGHELYILEIAGKGSPYAFSDERIRKGCHIWKCLFPDGDMNEITPAEARKKISHELDEIAPDIVFAGAIAYPSGASAVKWCGDHHCPVVIFDNARLADVPRGKITNWIKKQIYSNVDAMLIPAPSHEPDFRFWGIRKLYYGLNAVDNDYWKNLSQDSLKTELLRKKYSLPESFLLGVGRQVRKKNWISLLQAYLAADCRRPLVLVGNGPEHSELQRFSDQHSLGSRIIFLDFLPPDDLAPLYRQASAVILPSFSGETWGLTINEAMACGTPVLVSRQCGCCETLCIDGKTGFSFSPDPEDIARALRQFESLTSSEWKKMAENAEKSIREWGVDRFSDSVLIAIDDLCGKTKKKYHSLLSRMIVNLWKGRYRPV